MTSSKKKVLWLDTETTGLDPVINDIHQLAALMEINGEVVASFNQQIRPWDMHAIENRALDVSGVTREQVALYKPPQAAYKEFTGWLGQHLNKFDKTDKAYPGGYRTRFDQDFLREFFVKAGDKYYGSWVNHRGLDPLPLVRLLDFYGELDLYNLKLSTVCENFGVELGDSAHDALADVHAARNLFYRLTSKRAGHVLVKGQRLSYPCNTKGDT